MFRGAGKKFAHHFPKIFQVERSIVFSLLPGKEDGLPSLELEYLFFYSLCFLQLDATVGRSLNVCLGFAFQKGTAKAEERRQPAIFGGSLSV